jgi:hypothetical protein
VGEFVVATLGELEALDEQAAARPFEFDSQVSLLWKGGAGLEVSTAMGIGERRANSDPRRSSVPRIEYIVGLLERLGQLEALDEQAAAQPFEFDSTVSLSPE